MKDKSCPFAKILEDYKPLPPIVPPLREHFGTILDKENRMIATALDSEVAKIIVEAINNREDGLRFQFIVDNFSWFGFQMPSGLPLPNQTIEHSFDQRGLARGDLTKTIDRLRNRKVK